MTDPGAWQIPFGKHRGKRLDEIPAGYLVWCLENISDLRPDTRAAIEAYLTPPDRRAGDEPEPAIAGHGMPQHARPPRPPRRARTPAGPCQPLEAWADDPESAAERCRCPDSPQYRAYGNAVTVDVVEWIGARLMTIASVTPQRREVSTVRIDTDKPGDEQ